jgi:hypothetical protein
MFIYITHELYPHPSNGQIYTLNNIYIYNEFPIVLIKVESIWKKSYVLKIHYVYTIQGIHLTN